MTDEAAGEGQAILKRSENMLRKMKSFCKEKLGYLARVRDLRGTFDIIQDFLGFEMTTCGSRVKVGKVLNTIFSDFYLPMSRTTPENLISLFQSYDAVIGVIVEGYKCQLSNVHFRLF